MSKKAVFVITTFAIVMTLTLGKGLSFAVTAEENYKWYCSQCHGLTGKGDGINVTKDMAVTPRNHSDPKEMSKLSDVDITNAITEGGPANSKSPLMPPFGKTMTAQEIKDMVVYIRKLCNCVFKKE